MKCLEVLRKEKGLNMKEAATAMRIPYTTYVSYEKGDREPNSEMLIRLAEFYNTTIDYLLGRSDKSHMEDTDFLSNISIVKKASPLSDEAVKLAQDYDNLDVWGRQAVRELADTELERMADEARFMEESTPEEEPRVINLYLEPSAAGIATPTFGVDFEPYTLQKDDPKGASFAERIQGDSMEPYFPDGSIVFVNHDAMADGDIGIFCVDGGTVCKQYHRDPLGMVYLFSLNRKCEDADVCIPPSSNRSLICQGRVITKRRFPIPM